MNTSDNHALGDFLRARRQRLDPATFGFPAGRRRTPGLRREEVAQLASISPTWYTWLEQGRGGAPSREVLERIARGLRLTTPEREHLFILAFGHPPQTRLTVTDDMTPRLQRVLDAFTIPAIIRTASWDVIAWNAPAARVLTDYSQLCRWRSATCCAACLPGRRPAALWRTGRGWGSLSSTPSAPTSRGWAPRKKLTS